MRTTTLVKGLVCLLGLFVYSFILKYLKASGLYTDHLLEILPNGSIMVRENSATSWPVMRVSFYSTFPEFRSHFEVNSKEIFPGIPWVC